MSLAQGRHASTPRRRRIGLTRDRLALNIKGAQKHGRWTEAGTPADCRGGATMAAGRAGRGVLQNAQQYASAYRHSHTHQPVGHLLDFYLLPAAGMLPMKHAGPRAVWGS